MLRNALHSLDDRLTMAERKSPVSSTRPAVRSVLNRQVHHRLAVDDFLQNRIEQSQHKTRIDIAVRVMIAQLGQRESFHGLQ
ncbi:hypothetical protein D1872_335590 [compost metagenome]